MDARADQLIREHEQMVSDRGVWESHWREVAERVLPRQNWFAATEKTEGNKKNEKVFDATANLALDRFAAAMESMLTPRTQRWHKLKVKDPALQENMQIQEYLDEVTSILFQVRYSPKSNFASQAHENYISLGAFGSGALFIDAAPGSGVRYKHIHLSEIYFAENFVGVIDKVSRKFEMTARQAIQTWGDKVSEQIRTAMEKSPEKKFEFLHCVKPNEDMKSDRKNYEGMKFASYYIELETRNTLQVGGYRTFPYAVSRYVTGPKEVYGRSPAMTVLPDIKMLNEMSKTVIRAAHKIVDPPLLLQEDGVLQAFSARPGALNYGGVDDQGRQVVQPLQTGARVDIGLEMMDQRRKVINDAFLITLFQILVEAPNMTATEAMLRAQEKGALLAPTMGRQQSEMLGPLIERELDILGSAGMLPPMPEALREIGGDVDVEYVSPLNRAQRAEEGVAILRTLESIAPLAQIDPDVMMVFNPEMIARELAEINGVPAKILRSREEVDAMREEQAQAAEAQQLLAAAPVLSSSARDLASAQQLAGNVPAALPL